MSNLANSSKIDIMKGYRRLGAFPLDDTCVFMSYTEALNYVKSSRSYLGQVIVVLNDDNPATEMSDYNGTSVAYIIDYSRNLVPIIKDAYFSKTTIINEINELTKTVEEARTLLESALNTTHYVKYSSITGYLSDDNNDAKMSLVFRYGDNQVEKLDIVLDKEYFQINNDGVEIEFSGHTATKLTLSDNFKNIISLVFNNEIRITKLEENLDIERQRALDAEQILRDEINVERNRLTDESNRLTDEINRSKNTDLDLLNAHNKNVTRLDEHENELVKIKSDIQNRVEITDNIETVNLKDIDTSVDVPTNKSFTSATNIDINRPITSTIGNFKYGDVLSNKSLVDVVENIIYKNIEPEIELTNIVADTGNIDKVIKLGTINTVNSISGTICENRYPINAVDVEINGTNYSIGKTVVETVEIEPTITIPKGNVNVSTVYGYHGYILVEFDPVDKATSYNIEYDYGQGLKTLPKELIYRYNDKMHAVIIDAPNNIYTITVTAVENNMITECTTTLDDNALVMRECDSSGFANTTGGYGEGRIHTDADIIYITKDNVKTVQMYVGDILYTGLQTILEARTVQDVTTPLIIRIIGELKYEDLDKSLSKQGLLIQTSNLTLEGIGPYSCINGFGIHVNNSNNVEICNLSILNAIDDCISLDKHNTNIWIHDINFFYGQAGDEDDQIKGDGSLDIKQSQYVTVSHNHFIDSGKVSLIDSKVLDTDYSDYITFHHNWFEYSDSRMPRIRNSKAVHIYNNYYDNVLIGISATSGSSVLAERNLFVKTKYPILSSLQGTDETLGLLSGEDGGLIKSFENRFIDCINLPIDYSTNNTSFDVYIVSDKSEIIPDTVVTLVGNHTYSNFDTTNTMYSYTTDTTPSCMVKTGTTKFDISYEFTEEHSMSKQINQDLKSKITTYKSSILYKFRDIDLNQFTIEPEIKTITTKDPIIENLNNAPCSKIDFSYTFENPIELSSTTTFRFKFTTTNGISLIDETLSMINPIYYGNIQPNQNLSEIQITDLNELISDFTKDKNKSIKLTLNPNKESIILAYPESYGNLTKALDDNNFNILDIFTKSTIELNNISYLVYQSDIQTLENYNITFIL